MLQERTHRPLRWKSLAEIGANEMSVMRFLNKIGDWAGQAAAIAIVAIMVVAVFMRYALGAPLQWVEEILIAIFIWMIMLGAVSAIRVRGLVSIDAFTALLPQAAQRWVQAFDDIVVIVVLCALGWLGLELALDAGDKITPILGISYTYIDLAIPVGCFWMALSTAINLFKDITGAAAAPQGEER